jgi:DGQHR domain-containing protein
MARTPKSKIETVRVRALRTSQGTNNEVFSFFLRGKDILRIADLARISRDTEDFLQGFQRREIKKHVKDIVDYLDQGDVLFPNAIILAMSPDVKFKEPPGRKAPGSKYDEAVQGHLEVPILEEGRRAAWIVDGQQRSLALSETKNKNMVVPVVAFSSPDIATHREQFVLVNKARPLPKDLISELLPEIGVLLPRELSKKRLPAELCLAMHRSKASPFFGIVQRQSDLDNKSTIIKFGVLEKCIEARLRPPHGALLAYTFGDDGTPDTDGMFESLVAYWTAVRDTFPDAWGLSTKKSRLMHSAGILAMGIFMDHVMQHADRSETPEAEIKASLARIAPFCAWTSGRWDELGWDWNTPEQTSRYVNTLGGYLSGIEKREARRDK